MVTGVDVPKAVKEEGRSMAGVAENPNTTTARTTASRMRTNNENRTAIIRIAQLCTAFCCPDHNVLARKNSSSPGATSTGYTLDRSATPVCSPGRQRGPIPLQVQMYDAAECRSCCRRHEP